MCYGMEAEAGRFLPERPQPLTGVMDHAEKESVEHYLQVSRQEREV